MESKPTKTRTITKRKAHLAKKAESKKPLASKFPPNIPKHKKAKVSRDELLVKINANGEVKNKLRANIRRHRKEAVLSK